MTEFVIAYDERDEDLGPYFQKCRDELVLLIQGLPNFPNRLNNVPANRCNKPYLDMALARLLPMPFIMAAYTHGNPKQLIVNRAQFLDADEDNTFFQRAFFYTNSCSSGKQLGPKLIEDQCSAFIGFDQDVDKLVGEYYQDLSIRCDNYGITAFLTQEISASEAYEQMRVNYTLEIQRMKRNGDILRAGMLISTRESLVFHGNRELMRDDLTSP